MYTDKTPQVPGSIANNRHSSRVTRPATMARIASVLFISFYFSSAYSQSSVTLYGVIDEGLNFTSNSDGKRGYAMVSGDTAASVWGLKGYEDLGAGTKVLFKLENMFSANNGALADGGRMFGRESWVGLADEHFGTVSLGRQYDPTIDMWSSFTAAGGAIGDFAAHPYDNDNSDYDFRISNAVKYVSPTFGGIQLEALYGFSNTSSFSSNRTYSAAATYTAGAFSSAIAYKYSSNPGSTEAGSVSSDDAVFIGASQQDLDAGIKWTFADKTNVAFAYSHVVVRDPSSNIYVGNIGALPWKSWQFDNFELNGQYFILPDFWLAASYTYTHAHLTESTGVSGQAWHQAALMVDYDLSKRTSLYAQLAYQHTNGHTGTGLDNAYIFGSTGPSSNGDQLAFRIAMMQKF